MRARAYIAVSSALASAALVACGLVVELPQYTTFPSRDAQSEQQQPIRDAASEGDAPTPVIALPDGGAEDDPLDASIDVYVAPADDAGDGSTNLSAISPSGPNATLTLARTADWTIGSERAGVIYYTTDGGAPSLTSPNAPSPLTLQLVPDQTTIKWFVQGDPRSYSFKVGADGNKKNNGGLIIEHFKFASSNSPVLRVAKGSLVQASLDLQVWSQTNCPGCLDQLIWGFSNPQNCFGNLQPGTYNGDKYGFSKNFPVRVPSNAGVYTLKVGYTQEFNCNDALKKSLGTTEIGVVIAE